MALAIGAGPASAADKYVVGVSNTLTGNGWREEMICSIKAQARLPYLRDLEGLGRLGAGPSALCSVSRV